MATKQKGGIRVEMPDGDERAVKTVEQVDELLEVIGGYRDELNEQMAKVESSAAALKAAREQLRG